MIPMTSSMTAAPRIVEPSRERSAPISSSVCAEMLTLVAVRMAPMKMPSQYSGRPNARPERDVADAAHLDEVGLEPRHEHQQQDADLREIPDEREERQGVRAGRRHENRPRKHVEQGGTEQKPGEDLSEDRRLMDAGGQRARHLGRGDDEQQQQEDLKRVGQRDLR